MIAALLRLTGDGTAPSPTSMRRAIMNELYDPSELGAAMIETTVRTTLTLPAWASAAQISEAMEILDPSLEPVGWHGARPAWGATTIYAPAKATVQPAQV
jgi:hypothetical protein